MRRGIVTVLLICGFLVSEAQITHRAFIPPDYVEPSREEPKVEPEVYINPYYEEINTLEDVIEWIGEDIWNGSMTKEVGELYVQNLEKVITRLKEEVLKSKVSE